MFPQGLYPSLLVTRWPNGPSPRTGTEGHSLAQFLLNTSNPFCPSDPVTPLPSLANSPLSQRSAVPKESRTFYSKNFEVQWPTLPVSVLAAWIRLARAASSAVSSKVNFSLSWIYTWLQHSPYFLLELVYTWVRSVLHFRQSTVACALRNLTTSAYEEQGWFEKRVWFKLVHCESINLVRVDAFVTNLPLAGLLDCGYRRTRQHRHS